MLDFDPRACYGINGWFPPPQGLAEIKTCYGDIQVAKGEITTKGWESAHMQSVISPLLPRGKIYVNRKVWPILKDALVGCYALGDGYQLRTLGCFNPRLQKRSAAHLSTHSWGIAFDLNEDTNPYSTDGVLRKDLPDAWIAEFTRRGFTWGGTFTNPDAMHFQFCSGF